MYQARPPPPPQLQPLHSSLNRVSENEFFYAQIHNVNSKSTLFYHFPCTEIKVSFLLLRFVSFWIKSIISYHSSCIIQKPCFLFPVTYFRGGLT